MDPARPSRRRVRPKREDSRKTGWAYRGLFPKNQGEAKNAAGFAWIHALGMMPGVPDLQGWQEDYLVRAACNAKTLRAQAHLLIKWQLIDKIIPLVSEAAMIEALGMGPLIAQTSWPDQFNIPTSKGFLELGGRRSRHSYVIAGYSEHRQAFRIANSRGPGWGQLGRAWISRATFVALWPDADILFAVATGVPWSPTNIDFMDSWEREYVEKTGGPDADATADGGPAAD